MMAAADRAWSHFGGVQVVCNNAGVGGGGGPLDQARTEDWDWVLDVNLKGVINGLLAFLPRMRDAGKGGHIVNTASLAGIVAPPGMGGYVATKFAVAGLSETLKQDLEPHGIGVSVLCPGFVRTRIHLSGRNRHEQIMEAPNLFGAKVMPEFKAREAERQQEKMERLAPFLEQAMARKRYMKPLEEHEIPEVKALGRRIVEESAPPDENSRANRKKGRVEMEERRKSPPLHEFLPPEDRIKPSGNVRRHPPLADRRAFAGLEKVSPQNSPQGTAEHAYLPFDAPVPIGQNCVHGAASWHGLGPVPENRHLSSV